MTTHTDFTVAAGERVPFVLTWHPSYARAPKPVDPYQAVDDTESYWAEWMSKSSYDGGWQGEVRRSLAQRASFQRRASPLVPV